MSLTARRAKTPRRAAWVSAAVTAAAYAATLLPGMGSFGDTAKFQFVGYVLGTTHEPGYPTYTLLNWAFTHVVAVGSVAWRANLLSLVLSAAAIGLLTRALSRLDVRPWIAAVAAILVGLAGPVWSQAVIAEVYGLQLLVVTATLHAVLVWRDTRTAGRRWPDGWLWIAIAWTGLGFTNHLTILLLVPGLVAFVLLTDWRVVTRPATWLVAVLVGAAAVGSYGYLAWRTADPTVAYLETRLTRLADLPGIWSGEQFYTGSFGRAVTADLGESAANLGRVAAAWTPTTWWLLPAAIVGAVTRRERALSTLLSAWTVAMLAYALLWSVVDVEFQIGALYVALGVWTALGLEWLARSVAARGVTGWGMRAAAMTLVVAVLTVAAITGGRTVVTDQHRERPEQFALALSSVPDRAALVADDYTIVEWLDSLTLLDPRFRDAQWTVVDPDIRPRAIADFLNGDGFLPHVAAPDGRGAAPGTPVYAIGTNADGRLHGPLCLTPQNPGVWHVTPCVPGGG